jgi:hypothetical protein
MLTYADVCWRMLRAQLVSRIVRPSPLVRKLLRSVRNSVGLSGPYISVHIRRCVGAAAVETMSKALLKRY